MGKKKPSNKSAGKEPDEAVPEATNEQAAAEPAAAAVEEESIESPAEQQLELPSTVPELQDKVKELAAELAEVRQHAKQLEIALAQKDADLASARSDQGTGAKADAFKNQDVQKLQERLAQLRKEQAEADAARDAAWKQLKSVVNSISKLASPDYLASINIPS